MQNGRLKVVVVGGVACGPKAASRLMRLIPDAEITLVERGDEVSYGACGLPYYVEGMFADIQTLQETPVGAIRNAAFFKKVKGFDVHMRTEATAIDRQRKVINVKALDTGREQELPYDKLVLATGGRPVPLRLPGCDLDGVVVMHHPEDGTRVREDVETKRVKRAVLIGAGLIGLEMTEALVAQGVEVTLVEQFDHIMPSLLDADMAGLAMKHMAQKGVHLVMGEGVTELEGDDTGRLTAVRTEKQRIPTDMALIAVGVRPVSDLAQAAGLRVLENGGVDINQFCQTSDPDIYAGGDCTINNYIHPITGVPIYAPQGSTANKHGRTIADHIAGIPSPFMGSSGTVICKAFDYTIGRTGLSEAQAKRFNLDVETVLWTGPDRPHYFEGMAPISVKLIASKKNRRLLGCQVVGPGDCAKRLDVAATALFFNAGIDDLTMVDLGYAPPYSPPLDPIISAAHIMQNKLDGIALGIGPVEAKKRIDSGEDLVLLDVRGPAEIEQMRMPYNSVTYIPLGALRERTEELPRDRDILAFCKISLRGYEAQRILNGVGFNRVQFIEGGLEGWPYELEIGPPRS